MRRRIPPVPRVRAPPLVRLYLRRVRRRHHIISCRRRRKAMVRPDSTRPAHIQVSRHARRQLDRMVERALRVPNPALLLDAMNRELGD